MTRTQLMAAVKDLHTDLDYAEFARQYGLRALAWLFDGKAPEQSYTLREFDGDNQFAHLLWRGRNSNEAL